MANTWSTSTDNLKRETESIADDISSRAEELAEEAKERMQSSMKAVEAVVKSYPLQSVLAGVALGILFSVALGRARKH